MNEYSYAGNSPTNLRDPSGNNPGCLVGGLIGSIGFNGYVIYKSMYGRKSEYYAGWSGLARIAQGNLQWFGAGCAIGGAFGAGLATSSGDGLLSLDIPNNAVPTPDFVVTENGTAVPIPEGWVGRFAENEQGLVYQDPESVFNGDADSLRIADPNAQNPDGYVRIYNSEGQPLTPEGNPGPPSATHISTTYNGPINLP